MNQNLDMLSKSSNSRTIARLKKHVLDFDTYMHAVEAIEPVMIGTKQAIPSKQSVNLAKHTY